MVRLGRGADDGEPTGDRELDQAGTDPAGRPVHDEQPAGVELEQVQQPGGGLDRDRERCRLEPWSARPGSARTPSAPPARAYVAEPLPKTRSPTATPTTPSPTSSTTPAASRPRTWGRSSGIASFSIPERTFQSNGLTPDASTAIRTCPGTGVRVGCVADLQDAGVAVLLELDCAHGSLLEVGVFAGQQPDRPRPSAGVRPAPSLGCRP